MVESPSKSPEIVHRVLLDAHRARLGTSGCGSVWSAALIRSVTVAVLVSAPGIKAQSVTPASDTSVTAANADPSSPVIDALHRRISIDLTKVQLRDALLDIARRAEVGIVQGDSVATTQRTISVHLKNATVEEVLRVVLKGSGLRPTMSKSGMIVIVRDTRRAGVDVGVGAIYGRIRDSLSAKPLAGAVVTVRGMAKQMTTTDSGFYIVPKVPAGVRTVVVRMLGYVPAERVVVVVDSQNVQADLELAMSMSRMQEVVTTATGPRRRLELGNDIALINADSIVATQPIANVTALLEGRVPGLDVQHTSGSPGDPSRLRLRGAGSLYESNDPIVILDGVRIYSAQSDARSGNLAQPTNAAAPATSQKLLGTAAPSPIDQIDPNSIEKIEVLKGPSAATLYGSDAANGVILITTKRGKAGPPVWSTSIDRGLTYMPGSYPEHYFSWGHGYADNAPIWCAVTDLTCTADSLVRFQPLNDPSLTVLGHGNRTAVTMGLSGGSSVLGYSLTGSGSQDIGLLTLPTFAERQFAAAQGSNPPSWMQRPQDYKAFSGSSRITLQVSKDADISLTSMFSRDDQQRSSLENEIADLSYTYVDPTTGTYQTASSVGYQPSPQLLSAFYQRTTDQATNFRSAMTVNWRPLSWLSGTADAGFDLISREDELLLPRGYSPSSDSVGLFNRGTGGSFVTTVNLRGVATTPLPAGFTLQMSAGANYTSTRTNDSFLGGTDVPVGAVSPEQAKVVGFGESRTDVETIGWYVEPTFSRKRLWISTGLRLDGGNNFGSHVSLAGFPKVSVSYLLSDEPFFPFKRLFNTLRLRAAYGHAGVQPGVGDRLRLYSALLPAALDSQSVNVIQLQSLGNATLKPERSTELESGVDVDVFDDRVTLGFTVYRKTREDALMQFPLPPSVYGEGAQILENIGVIRNNGVEASVGTQLVRSRAITWSAQLSFSKNSNVVASLSPGVAALNTTSNTGGVSSLFRLEPGYPLFGIWARPIIGYADANSDGVLEPSEVLVGDSLAFMGASTPDYSASLSTGLSLFGGVVHLDAGFLYEHGLTQISAADIGRTSASRALNDPTTPRSELAGILVLTPDLGPSLLGLSTPYGVIQSVSLLRFNSLSIAYNAPASFAKNFGASALAVALQGTDLGLFTNYHGKDPNVNAYPNGNNVLDTGQLPAPRTWQLRVSLRY